MNTSKDKFARRLARWDIETGKESDAILRKFYEPLSDFSEDECKAKFATARKGDAKAVEFIAAKKAEREQEQKEHWLGFVDKAALYPTTGRIVAIGIRENGKSRILTARNDAEEKAIITEFLAIAAEIIASGGVLEGFNTDDFDNSFVFRRALKYRISPAVMRSGRYWHAAFRDLLQVWRCGQRQVFISLDKIAEYLGTEHRKNGSGKHFAELFETEPEKALLYLDNDLMMTDEVGDALKPLPSEAVAGDDIPFGPAEADAA